MQQRLLIYCAGMLIFSLIFAGCGGGGGGGGGPASQTITNQQVVNLLVNGSSTAGFTGIASHIDTMVPFSGIPMYPDEVVLDAAAVALINKNVNSFLTVPSTPLFDNGSLPYPSGVTVDVATRTISVVSGAVTLSWTFLPNSVTRTYSSPEKTSTYVYSTVSGQTSVTFDESVNRAGVSATYNGTATYQRDTVTNGVVRLLGATFDQARTETNGAGKTFTVNGTVRMGAEDSLPGNLAFSGSFSLYLPPYGQVSGSVKADSMTYLKGYSPAEKTYYDSNLTDATAITFTSPTVYSDVSPVTNPEWLQGVWSGTFTDAPASGTLALSVSATAYSWWGESADKSRFYGSSVKYISDNSIEFYNYAVLWGTGKRNIDNTISGTWSLNGRSGTFGLTKQ